MKRFLRREAVDHVGVSDQDQVQPPAPPLSTCGHAELSPPGLQQLPDLLQHRQPTQNQLQATDSTEGSAGSVC